MRNLIDKILKNDVSKLKPTEMQLTVEYAVIDCIKRKDYVEAEKVLSKVNKDLAPKPKKAPKKKD